MALNSLFCADVPLSNYSLTHLQGWETGPRPEGRTGILWEGQGAPSPPAGGSEERCELLWWSPGRSSGSQLFLSHLSTQDGLS